MVICFFRYLQICKLNISNKTEYDIPMKIQRSLYAILEKRLSSVQPFIQIITGPRQVGKSTAIKQIIQKSPETSMYVSLDTSGNTGLETITFNWNLASLDYS